MCRERGAGSGDLTVILVMTRNIHHCKPSNSKHILPWLDQSQTFWTTKWPVMSYLTIKSESNYSWHNTPVILIFSSVPAMWGANHKLCLKSCTKLAWKRWSRGEDSSVFFGTRLLLQRDYLQDSSVAVTSGLEKCFCTTWQLTSHTQKRPVFQKKKKNLCSLLFGCLGNLSSSPL